jgi:hypothetical protein
MFHTLLVWSRLTMSCARPLLIHLISLRIVVRDYAVSKQMTGSLTSMTLDSLTFFLDSRQVVIIISSITLRFDSVRSFFTRLFLIIIQLLVT